jgi:hypothetical protein
LQLRIAVTVNMIATGTDITAPRRSAYLNGGAILQSAAESRDNPLEVLLCLRDVRSRVYFEQMKGRGTRVLTPSEMQAGSGEDARTKDTSSSSIPWASATATRPSRARGSGNNRSGSAAASCSGKCPAALLRPVDL